MEQNKKIKDFILETLLPYKNGIEGFGTDNHGGCVYLSENGNRCAVGKWLKSDEALKSTLDARGLIESYGAENIFKDKALEMNISPVGWDLIQNYHDCLSAGFNTKTMFRVVVNLENHFNINLDELQVVCKDGVENSFNLNSKKECVLA